MIDPVMMGDFSSENTLDARFGQIGAPPLVNVGLHPDTGEQNRDALDLGVVSLRMEPRMVERLSAADFFRLKCHKDKKEASGIFILNASKHTHMKNSNNLSWLH